MRRLARRLAQEESGFSLVELLVASMIGLMILFSAFLLLDLSGKSTRKTGDRVEAVQKGRLAMDQITQMLRSQICPGIAVNGVQQPAVETAEADRIVFYSSLGPAPDGAAMSGKLPLQRREIRFVPTSGDRGNIVVRVWNGDISQRTPTFPDASVTPASTRTIATDVSRASSTKPFLRYLKYDAVNSPDMSPLTAPITAAGDRALIVRVDVAFDAMPSVGTDTRLKTIFEDRAFVRTADPTDPTHSPKCI